MIDVLLMLMFLLGSVFMVAASIIGIWNYRRTRNITNYWLIFSLATFIGGTVWFGLLLEIAGVFSSMFPSTRRFLSIVFTTLLVIVALETLTTDADVTIEQIPDNRYDEVRITRH